MSLSLEVSRTIRAEPSKVFEAWTDPKQLVQWWGPPGGRCTKALVDLKIGGEYGLENVTPTGDTVWIRGVFLEIDHPTRLVYTWSISDPAEKEKVTVRFTACPEGTQVVVLHERVADEQAAEGHRLGWQACLDGLTTLLPGAAN